MIYQPSWPGSTRPSGAVHQRVISREHLQDRAETGDGEMTADETDHTSHPSWPGLTRPSGATHQFVISREFLQGRAATGDRGSPGHDGSTSEDPVVKILPVGIPARDQIELPRPGPSLDACFALDRGRDLFVAFGENQTNEVVPSGEARMHSLPMFPGPARQIIGDARIDHAKWPVRDNVNPAAEHAETYGARVVNKTSTPVPHEMAGSGPAMTSWKLNTAPIFELITGSMTSWELNTAPIFELITDSMTSRSFVATAAASKRSHFVTAGLDPAISDRTSAWPIPPANATPKSSCKHGIIP